MKEDRKDSGGPIISSERHPSGLTSLAGPRVLQWPITSQASAVVTPEQEQKQSHTADQEALALEF